MHTFIALGALASAAFALPLNLANEAHGQLPHYQPALDHPRGHLVIELPPSTKSVTEYYAYQQPAPQSQIPFEASAIAISSTTTTTTTTETTTTPTTATSTTTETTTETSSSTYTTTSTSTSTSTSTFTSTSTTISTSTSTSTSTSISIQNRRRAIDAAKGKGYCYNCHDNCPEEEKIIAVQPEEYYTTTVCQYPACTPPQYSSFAVIDVAITTTTATETTDSTTTQPTTTTTTATATVTATDTANATDTATVTTTDTATATSVTTVTTSTTTIQETFNFGDATAEFQSNNADILLQRDSIVFANSAFVDNLQNDNLKKRETLNVNFNFTFINETSTLAKREEDLLTGLPVQYGEGFEATFTDDTFIVKGDVSVFNNTITITNSTFTNSNCTLKKRVSDNTLRPTPLPELDDGHTIINNHFNITVLDSNILFTNDTIALFNGTTTTDTGESINSTSTVNAIVKGDTDATTMRKQVNKRNANPSPRMPKARKRPSRSYKAYADFGEKWAPHIPGVVKFVVGG